MPRYRKKEYVSRSFARSRLASLKKAKVHRSTGIKQDIYIVIVNS